MLGRSPVLFFFLLSGLVLSRSLRKEGYLTSTAICAFYIRRFFRLYPAVFLSVALGSIAAFFYHAPTDWSPIDEGCRNVMSAAKSACSIKGFFSASVLVDININPPLWTIRAELVCSFLLPLVLISVKRFDRLAMPVALFLALALWRGGMMQLDRTWFVWSFLFAFYLGHLISLIFPYLKNLSADFTKWMLLLLLLLWAFSMRGGFNDIVGTIALAGLLAVLAPCNWLGLKALLLIQPLQFLGRISFSLYLLHWPILCLTWMGTEHFRPEFLHIQPQFIPATIVFFISIFFTIPLAALSEKLVERPFNNIGHQLSKHLLQTSS